MTSTTPPTCIISENPDIAGIGVRLSIYIPALVVTLHCSLVIAKVFVDILTGEISRYTSPSPGGPENFSHLNNSRSSESGSAIELADRVKGTTQPRSHSSSSSPGSMTPTTSNPSEAVSNDSSNRTNHGQLRGYLRYLSAHKWYFESTKALEISLYLIGFSMIASAFLNATNFISTIGLPPYHALIILNISLIITFSCSSFQMPRISLMLAAVELEEDYHWQDGSAGIMSELTFLWYRCNRHHWRQFGVHVYLSWMQAFYTAMFGSNFWLFTTCGHFFAGYSMTLKELLSVNGNTIAASSEGAQDPSQCISITFYWAFIALPIDSMLPIQIVSVIFYVVYPDSRFLRDTAL
ncbi:hypothetical protein C8R42DRAFT_762768 [Lentinula raphanica]|nr:hypothetical protein C8R42DRAFT_762768 [Lentinula raphanica]